MSKLKVVVLEGEEERGNTIKDILEGSGQFETHISKSPRPLMNLLDGTDEVKVVITNTTVSTNEQDGLKFIKALYLKYQRYKQPLPPIIVCSSDQTGDTVKLYAYRFADASLISYVYIKDEELEEGGSRLLDLIAKSLKSREELVTAAPEEDVAEVVKKKLKSLLQKTVTLPQLPDVAVQVQDALKDPEVTFKKLANIINTDMTMGANVIKLANSPQFGVSGQIGTIEDACKQVGLNAIANTVMAAKVFDAMEALPSDFDLKRLRRHSYAVGTVARLVSRRCRVLKKSIERMQFSGLMFAAGLLHDIGKVLMTQFFPEECIKILEEAMASDSTAVDAEVKVLGVSHGDAGLHAGVEWHFPVLLVNVIGRHHWPLQTILSRLKTRQGRLAQRVIRIADAASYEMGYDMLRSDGKPPNLEPELFNKTGLDIDEFAKWTKEMKDDIAYTIDVLGKT